MSLGRNLPTTGTTHPRTYSVLSRCSLFNPYYLYHVNESFRVEVYLHRQVFSSPSRIHRLEIELQQLGSIESSAQSIVTNLRNTTSNITYGNDTNITSAPSQWNHPCFGGVSFRLLYEGVIFNVKRWFLTRF